MARLTLNILFLCTNNSTRSILAEAILNHLGAGRVHGFSAGSHPRGTPNPLALKFLERSGLPTAGLRSKSWDEFALPEAPVMDLVITVCDQAAGEVCPIWPGGPIKAHWGVGKSTTKSAASEEEILVSMAFMYQQLESRIRQFLDLPLESMDAATLKVELNRIGHIELNGIPFKEETDS
ncbi:MAG: arsenate reductase ArsC [Magnetococcales bacterium]|nr:arsenate reductase ArsC [Magnetococcales bacterium]